MKSLSEHNAERSAHHHAIANRKAHRHGINVACPKCSSELFNSTPWIVLTSFPPKINVKCSNDACDYVGYAVK